MSQEKEVSFYDYCPQCKYYDVSGAEEPCDECLSNPSNIDSHKPVNFKEKNA